MGRGFAVYVMVGMSSHTKAAQEGFERAMSTAPEVAECHNIAGPSNILRVECANLWHRVMARQNDVREMMNFGAPDDTPLRRDLARRPKFLLSGLLKCGCCGANYILINRTRYGCSGSRNKVWRCATTARLSGGRTSKLGCWAA